MTPKEKSQLALGGEQPELFLPHNVLYVDVYIVPHSNNSGPTQVLAPLARRQLAGDLMLRHCLAGMLPATCGTWVSREAEACRAYVTVYTLCHMHRGHPRLFVVEAVVESFGAGLAN